MTLDTVIAWISTHPFQTFGMYVFVMLITQALPKPDSKSWKAYLFLYSFLHLISFNVGLILKMLKVPVPTIAETVISTVEQSSDGAVKQTIQQTSVTQNTGGK